SSPPFTSNALDQYQGDLQTNPPGLNPPPLPPPPPPPLANLTLSTTWGQGANPNALVLIDTAHLANGNNPTGTITFTLYGRASSTVRVDTEVVTVNGNGTYTTPTGYTVPTGAAALGSYQWDATYSGDASNNAVSDVNDPAEEVFVVAGVSLSTAPSAPTVTLG